MSYLVSPVVAATILAQEPTPADDEAIRQAVLEEVHFHEEEVLSFLVYQIGVDSIHYTDDGQMALVWLSMSDRETGEVIAAEPGLAVAQRSGDTWQITLQVDDDWQEKYALIPNVLISPEVQFLADPAEDVQPSAALSGYRLPWPTGRTVRLTGSIAHEYDYQSCAAGDCLYAFDFADGTMFPIHAARSGQVFAWQITCENGTTGCTNYIILRDPTTTPVSYQIYYHLAYDSIPSALRQSNVHVSQGQYIGDVDDTGASTGHHLHFHVHTSSYGYWGSAVDITFDDVYINGGRPRTCVEVAAYQGRDGWYSQCMPSDQYTAGAPYDPTMPTGGFTSLTDGQVLTGPEITITGWMSDNTAVYSAQVLVDIGNGWENWGAPQYTTPFTLTYDLCEQAMPQGPFTLAMRVTDAVGNVAEYQGLIKLVNNHNCNVAPPPGCGPADNEITSFGGWDYQTDCTIFGVGGQAALYPDNDADSYLVGSDVRLTLYDQTNYGGRAETIISSDGNIYENPMYPGRPSSLRVNAISDPPTTPQIRNPQPNLSQAITTADSIVLSWNGSDRADEYQGTLTGTTGFSASFDWQTSHHWAIGSLPAGNYTFTLTGRNSAGTAQGTLNFSVQNGTLPAADTLDAPLTIDFESGSTGWTSSGLWRFTTVTGPTGSNTQAWVFNNGANYSDANIRAGDLTSPPIAIPPGNFYLRMGYFNGTEYTNPVFLSGSDWDQRHIQVSVNGGPFEELTQLSGDGVAQWLEYQAIDLSAYAGQTIRLRFHFNTIDEYYNTNGGWTVDDISITAAPPDQCGEPNDNTISGATELVNGTTFTGTICAQGDQDYYQLTADMGQVIIADLSAIDQSSTLSPYLTLLEPDGTSPVWTGSRRDPGGEDPLLFWSANHADIYYLRVRSFDQPTQGNASADYSLQVWDSPPWETPIDNHVPATDPFTLRLALGDSENIAQVEFLYHTPDWVINDWQSLCIDTDGTDGYTCTVNPVSLGIETGGAFFAQVTVSAFNTAYVGSAIWNLQLDGVAPQSQMVSLPATHSTTHFPLTWSVTSDESMIDHFEIQMRIDGGTWQNVATGITSEERSREFWGLLGHTYEFRMRAIATTGQIEAYPSSAEATTQLLSCSGDGWEDTDDVSGGATLLSEGVPQTHTICAAGDSDWVRIAAVAGEQYLLSAHSLGGGASINIAVYGPNNPSILVDQYSTDTGGEDNGIAFTAASTGTYYVRLSGYDPLLGGSSVSYQIELTTAELLYAPMAH
ncbi:MAG TPA: peptidoglycan DD-metalloendopeptidase family protein [Longilinea sp.]|nr:peptidoglycan DD-metalloendopeptidase family protein [Longilinea sp.]